MLVKEIHAHVNSALYASHLGKNISYSCMPNFDDVQEIKSVIQENGFAVINCREKSLLATIKLIKQIGGTPIKNTAGGRTGYLARIVNSNYNTGHFKTYTSSMFAQPLHTDGGHLPQFPRFVSFYCVKPAATGGVSTIVKVSELLSVMHRLFDQSVNHLLETQFLQLDTMYDKNINKQILFKLNEIEMGMSYWPVMFNVKTTEIGYHMLTVINQFIHDPVNQYRFKLKQDELLLLDNCKVLHSRTAFDQDDNRYLLRLWNGHVTPTPTSTPPRMPVVKKSQSIEQL